MPFQKMVNAMKKKSGSSKLLVVGLDNAGKTSVLNVLFGVKNIASPTFGYKIHALRHKNSNLTIVDIGGQSSFKRYWPNHFEHADGVLFVFDCSDGRDFSGYLQSVLELDVPVCIMANKTDLNPLFAADQLSISVSYARSTRLFKTSVLDEQSIACGFEWLLDRVNHSA
jgi:small GTP-binding protein